MISLTFGALLRRRSGSVLVVARDPPVTSPWSDSELCAVRTSLLDPASGAETAIAAVARGNYCRRCGRPHRYDGDHRLGCFSGEALEPCEKRSCRCCGCGHAAPLKPRSRIGPASTPQPLLWRCAGSSMPDWSSSARRPRRCGAVMSASCSGASPVPRLPRRSWLMCLYPIPPSVEAPKAGAR